MASVGVWALVGCTNELPDGPAMSQQPTGQTTPGDTRLAAAGLTADGTSLSLRSSASGYLLHQRALIAPWCGAVLVDPSTVLTAAHCAVEVAPRSLSVGFGAVGEGPTYAVKAIELHPLYQPEQATVHDIARLTLSEPVREVRPMALAAQVAAEEPVSVVSYLLVPASHEGARRVYDGTSQSAPEGLSAVFAGADTNCHGESGAGLFRLGGDSSELLGIASTGSYDPPHPVYPACLGRLFFAPVSANLDFIAPSSP